MSLCDVRAAGIHRNMNENTASTNKLATESLKTSQTFLYKYIKCVSGWTFPFTILYLQYFKVNGQIYLFALTFYKY